MPNSKKLIKLDPKLSYQPFNKNISLNQSKGFTLIELLVTIAIIAIISVVAVALFGNVQSTARDAKRKAELESISNALEVNKSATTSFYATPAKTQFGGSIWPGQTATSGTEAEDPQGYPYCIATATNGTPPSVTAIGSWASTGAVPRVCATGSNSIYDSMTAFTSVNAYTICTRLESGGGTIFCRTNRQ